LTHTDIQVDFRLEHESPGDDGDAVVEPFVQPTR
jgi:hypothetical protein